MKNWLKLFANPFTTGIYNNLKEEILDDTVKALKPSLCDNHGNWMADYVRLRFCATL